MRLRYPKPDGSTGEILLGDEPITIGRSSDADVPVLDERASRTHCGVRLWDGEYYIKDLKSKNGTYVNADKVEMGKIRPGDKIRIGTFVIQVEDENAPGADTIMKSVEDGMDEGKGFKTMLREIVEDVEEAEKAQQPPEVPEEVSAKQTVVRKKVKTVIKKKKAVSFESDEAAAEEAPAVEEPPAIEFDEAPAEAEAPVQAEAPVEAEAAEPPPPPPEPAPAEPAADAPVEPDKPKTIMLKSKPKKPVQIRIKKNED